MTNFKYDTSRGEGQLTLSFEGELDMHVAPELRRVFHEELANSPPEVVIDLEQVPFIDSSVVATLVEALKLVRKQGGQLRIANCQAAVRDTFEIARLIDAFSIA